MQPTRKWKSNIKINLKERGEEDVDWRAVVNTVIKTLSSIKTGKVFAPLSDHRLLKKDSGP